ncbi:Bgt-50679 [Blumeria graminis f. sp. tritici]|uniref:Bgt-50679 n=1 Tax=Blumeria graminis f. sp. tritici TaxID=62690 RepID=A0A9X9MGY2_BLUGR|nr:Bgt-50679 [Blumeria graminis f. sp. tritici]
MQLLSKGFQVQSSNDGFGIFSPDGKVIASARPKGGLFCFNTCSSSSVPAKVMLSKNCQRDATELLHLRFAHVDPKLLGSISVPSLKLPTLKGKDENKFRIDNPTLHSCDVCNSCKQVERINRGPVSRSSNVLELVHSDTWGKCQAIGIFGSSCFVNFIDDLIICGKVLQQVVEIKQQLSSFFPIKDLGLIGTVYRVEYHSR